MQIALRFPPSEHAFVVRKNSVKLAFCKKSFHPLANSSPKVRVWFWTTCR